MNLQNKDGLVFSPHLTPDNIRNGIVVLGVTGDYIGTPYKGETNIIPGTEDQVLETTGKIVYTNIAVNKITPVCTDTNLNFNYGGDIDIGGKKTYNTIENLTDAYYVRAKNTQAGWYDEGVESVGANVFMISEEEQAKIIPKNIAAGVAILGVEGTAATSLNTVVFGGEPTAMATTRTRFTLTLKEISFRGFDIPVTRVPTFENSVIEKIDFADATFENVTEMVKTFCNCNKLTTLKMPNFNTQNMVQIFSAFDGCTALTNVTWGDNWGSNEAMTRFDVSDCPLSHDSCLDLFNKLATKTTMAILTLSSTTKSYMSDDEIAIATAKGWIIT